MKYKRFTTILSVLLLTIVFSHQARATAPCGGVDQPTCEIPEPGSLSIIALGIIGLAALKFKKK
ncbi:PEP-CTERM sorting domain-containing protein [Colwelliaceae bacterium 6441]